VGGLFQPNGIAVDRHAILRFEDIMQFITTPCMQIQLAQWEHMRSDLISPVEYRQDGLPLIFPQQKNARLLIFCTIGEKVYGDRRAAQLRHFQQSTIFQ